jgi:hypothetical protein
MAQRRTDVADLTRRNLSYNSKYDHPVKRAVDELFYSSLRPGEEVTLDNIPSKAHAGHIQDGFRVAIQSARALGSYLITLSKTGGSRWACTLRRES